MPPPNKAWRVIWSRMPDVQSIVAAPDRTRAKQILYSSLADAGYNWEWLDLKAVRAPKYDIWAMRQDPFSGCVLEEYVVLSMQEKGESLDGEEERRTHWVCRMHGDNDFSEPEPVFQPLLPRREPWTADEAAEAYLMQLLAEDHEGIDNAKIGEVNHQVRIIEVRLDKEHWCRYRVSAEVKIETNATPE